MSKVLLLLGLLLPCGLRAQTTADVLVGMAAQAGVIFAGEVVSIGRHDADGYVDVQFRVDSAVRGCNSGGTYTVREWAGRWLGHAERYRTGQQLLMLLTAPGPAGLSAPVYGGDGALPIVAGAAVATSAADATVAADAPGRVVDLRLLAARGAPAAPTAVTPNLIIVAPVAVDDAAALWPALTNVLALLRGGNGAR